MDTSDLAKRMKVYESVSKTSLMRREPVIIRLDGCHFHTFTKGFMRPFDKVLQNTMHRTMKYLCENIQGCVLGYTQSDEITLVLVDYKNLNTSPWFDYEVNKINSVAASMATLAFNQAFEDEFNSWGENTFRDWHEDFNEDILDPKDISLYRTYIKAMDKGAIFDCRCFNIPKDDVCNNLYWRQLDATRNSIQMLGQAHFSHKELQNKSCNNIKDMLISQKEINWDNIPTVCKRGCCCVKRVVSDDMGINISAREKWVLDYDIPMFKGDNRDYVESRIYFED